MNCAHWAGIDANRIQSLFEPVTTKIAFAHFGIFRIEAWGSVWAGTFTLTAAAALFAVYEYNAIFTLLHGAGRAYLNAGRLQAMVASQRNVIGKYILLPGVLRQGIPVSTPIFQYLAPWIGNGDAMIINAGRHTGLAAATGCQINKKGRLFHLRLSLYLRGLYAADCLWQAA